MTTVTDRTVHGLVDQAVAMLRASGRRMTASRRLLLQSLFAGGSHRTAEELTADIQAIAADVHLSTIYRNLDELERLGIIGQVDIGHGPATYYLATEHHGHVVCAGCGEVFEAPAELFGEIAKFALERHGVAIAAEQFAILGRCTRCVAKSASISTQLKEAR